MFQNLYATKKKIVREINNSITKAKKLLKKLVKNRYEVLLIYRLRMKVEDKLKS